MIQTMKFLIVEPFLLPILIPIGPKYSPQDPVFKAYNTKIKYKLIVDSRAAARSEKKKTFSTISRITFNTLFFNIVRVSRSRYVL